jgi:hypothetical protein
MLLFYQIFNIVLFIVFTAFLFYGAMSTDAARKKELAGTEDIPVMPMVFIASTITIACYVVTSVISVLICWVLSCLGT